MANDTAHDEHYGRVDDPAGAILSALGDPATLTIEDLAPADEFHLGGAAATSAIIDALKVNASDRVLDIGSGLGGPARRIAATTGAHVTGVDLTPSFVAAATALSGRLAMSHNTEFIQGDVTQLDRWGPGVGPFNAATLIHVGMNIPDKKAFFSGVHGLLAPGGRFVVFDIMLTGDPTEIAYPMPFASRLDNSFLESPSSYVDALIGAGFHVNEPVDQTRLARDAAASTRAASPPPVSLATVMGPGFATMFAKVSAALSAGLIAPVQIVATR